MTEHQIERKKKKGKSTSQNLKEFIYDFFLQAANNRGIPAQYMPELIVLKLCGVPSTQTLSTIRFTLSEVSNLVVGLFVVIFVCYSLP